MKWKVGFTNKANKQQQKLPKKVRELLVLLLKELELTGPVQGTWKNYSKLSDGSHHCHLNYRYVACWRETEKGLIIEVYYAGSRENAPY